MNRYAYCRNNPVNYTDPSGNITLLGYGLIYTGIAYLSGVKSSGSWNPFGWSDDDWWNAATLGTGTLTVGTSTNTGPYVDVGSGHYSPGESDQAEEQQDNYYDSLNQLNSALNNVNYFYDLYYQDPYENGGGAEKDNSVRIAEAGVSDVGTNWWKYIDKDGIPGYKKIDNAADSLKNKNYLSAASWWLSGAMEQFAFVGASYLGARGIQWISVTALPSIANTGIQVFKKGGEAWHLGLETSNNMNIIHIGRHPKFGTHIAIGATAPFSAKLHIYFQKSFPFFRIWKP